MASQKPVIHDSQKFFFFFPLKEQLIVALLYLDLADNYDVELNSREDIFTARGSGLEV